MRVLGRARPIVATVLCLAGAPVCPAADGDAGSEPRALPQARSHFRAGFRALAEARWESARDEFSRAVDLDPRFAWAHYGLGRAQMGLKRYDEAVQTLRRCRDSFLESAALDEARAASADMLANDRMRELRDMLAFLELATNRFGSREGPGAQTRAMFDVENAIRRIQESRQRRVRPPAVPAEVLLALGSSYYRMGALQDAEREYRAALDGDGGLGEAHNNLAVVCLLTDRPEEAQASLQRARKAAFPVDPRLEREIRKRLEAAERRPTP